MINFEAKSENLPVSTRFRARDFYFHDLPLTLSTLLVSQHGGSMPLLTLDKANTHSESTSCFSFSLILQWSSSSLWMLTISYPLWQISSGYLRRASFSINTWKVWKCLSWFIAWAEYYLDLNFSAKWPKWYKSEGNPKYCGKVPPLSAPSESAKLYRTWKTFLSNQERSDPRDATMCSNKKDVSFERSDTHLWKEKFQKLVNL